jgi:bacterioferritin-associated ferredoxin
MYVCVCRAVSDARVEKVIEGGAVTVEAITRACGAGGDCGACRGQLEDMIEERTAAEDRVPAAKLVRVKAA